MMRPSDELSCVYLCKQPVDMRKSINGLAALVEGTLALNPFICVGLEYVTCGD